jgi:hypothetical protein
MIMAAMIPELEPVGTLSFSAALEQAELLARQALPVSQHERISCAVAIIRGGDIFETDDHVWTVASQSQPGLEYRINGAGCSCEDAHYRAPQGRCKHVLATMLSRRAMQLIQAQQPPAPVVLPQEMDVYPDNEWPPDEPLAPEPPAAAPEVPQVVASPLPEAPVSITLKANLDGHEVLVTLRGTDFASVRAQVEEASAWLKAHAPATKAEAAPRAAQGEPPVCPYHGAMKASTKAPGTWYCASKMGDGSYCKERHP